ncbi:MAG: peptidylprolyl isomerase [Gemmatimonadaceae bacterium]|nr:peptidylprolyl isomerase [Gemmatimonadaceae bacterium]
MPGRSPALTRPSARGLAVAGAIAAAAMSAACVSLGVAPRPYPLAPPDTALLRAAGPDSFDVRFVTSRGPFTMRVHRDWAPLGAGRVYYLVRSRFFDGVRFFRVVNGKDGKPFVAQFGLNGDPEVTRAWRGIRLHDDPVRKSNVRGTVSFAAATQPNTRSTQLYINFGDNSRLDTTRFAVLGQVIQGMDSVVDSLYKGYPNVPSQDSIGRQGNEYLIRSYPRLDFIITARVTKEWKR